MRYAPKDTRSYIDWHSDAGSSIYGIVAVDEQKHNLTWLCYPEIDQKGLGVVPLPFIDSINAYMDKQTRNHLKTLPLMFMRYFADLSKDGYLALTEKMPVNYLSTMYVQAHKAQARLVQTEGNLVKPLFWEKK